LIIEKTFKLKSNKNNMNCLQNQKTPKEILQEVIDFLQDLKNKETLKQADGSIHFNSFDDYNGDEITEFQLKLDVTIKKNESSKNNKR